VAEQPIRISPVRGPLSHATAILLEHWHELMLHPLYKFPLVSFEGSRPLATGASGHARSNSGHHSNLLWSKLHDAPNGCIEGAPVIATWSLVKDTWGWWFIHELGMISPTWHETWSRCLKPSCACSGPFYSGPPCETATQSSECPRTRWFKDDDEATIDAFFRT